ncbi:MAG: hypothetical protein PHP52_07425 [Bacteroidales bacterium]|jgi:hypothetical protein|nr:hypothetical protein [Bacteroidales bacterium]MDY0140451.1 hypothetical protein [Bacteroidales bacterium]
MNKTIKIIIGILFSLSALFIGTGTLVVDTKFYCTNNTGKDMVILCLTSDNGGFETVAEPEEKVLVFQSKNLKFKNNSSDFLKLVQSISFIQSGDTTKIEDLNWKSEGSKRKNVFNLIIEP